ncbi:hypothetical protein OY671_010508, partial [Metschnikowia pulcherrima]
MIREDRDRESSFRMDRSITSGRGESGDKHPAIVGMTWSANFWKKQSRQWHWISSAICSAALMSFAVTGITLNHAASIEAKPTTTTRNIALPAALRGRSESVAGEKPLPADLTEAIRAASGVDVANALPEVAESELFFDSRGPGTEGTS